MGGIRSSSYNRSDRPKSTDPRLSAIKPYQSNTTHDIAPWLTEGPDSHTPGFNTRNIFSNERPIGSSRTEENESPDPLSRGDDRAPSVKSATTASSGNSWSRPSTKRKASSKKVAAPYPQDDGRVSPRSSDISIPDALQREQTSSSRHESLKTKNSDGGPVSPTNSRPRTPTLPPSDVTPWMYQEFQVCNYLIIRASCLNPMLGEIYQ